MDLDFIEIGTSNFSTWIQRCTDSQTGISVDAVKHYVDCLPVKDNVRKIHVALTSDRKSDFIDVYYIPENVIDSNGLDHWFRGCNAIGNYHPLHINYNVKHLVTIEQVPLLNIDEFLVQQNVRKIKYLKIDTEGHDCVILNGLFKYLETKGKEYYPDRIEFETHDCIPTESIDAIIEYAIRIGYKVIIRDYDTILGLEV